MVFRLIKKSKEKKFENCGFEVYSKKKNDLVSCGEKSVAKTSKCSLCYKHLHYFMAGTTKKHKFFDLQGKELDSKEEFLRLAEVLSNEND